MEAQILKCHNGMSQWQNEGSFWKETTVVHFIHATFFTICQEGLLIQFNRKHWWCNKLQGWSYPFVMASILSITVLCRGLPGGVDRRRSKLSLIHHYLLCNRISSQKASINVECLLKSWWNASHRVGAEAIAQAVTVALTGGAYAWLLLVTDEYIISLCYCRAVRLQSSQAGLLERCRSRLFYTCFF